MKSSRKTVRVTGAFLISKSVDISPEYCSPGSVIFTFALYFPGEVGSVSLSEKVVPSRPAYMIDPIVAPISGGKVLSHVTE